MVAQVLELDMKPNPYLKKLGFSDDDRVVILHADDIGMCQASITAFIDLWESRSISSATTMVPCPWFPAAAAYCRTHHQADLGVHTTLNSEWTNYRWAPLSTRDKNSGLLDEEGYLHHSSEGVQNNAEPSYVKIELITQVTRAFDPPRQ